MKYGYARVSTVHQRKDGNSLEDQRGSGCSRWLRLVFGCPYGQGYITLLDNLFQCKMDTIGEKQSVRECSALFGRKRVRRLPVGLVRQLSPHR